MLIFLDIKETTNFFFILLSIMMVFFCLYLYFNNKRLKERISKLEIEIKEILERKLVKEPPSDLVSIQNLSIDSKDKKLSSYQSNKNSPKSPNKSNQPKEKNDYKNNYYQKQPSVIIPIKKNNPPISTESTKEISASKKKIEDINNYYPNSQYKYNFQKMDSQNFNINEFIQKDEKRFPKIKENNKTIDYLNEISNQIADELTPKTIELTDYEKRQEEQAVISYQELLALKDKIQSQSEDEENITFIEDLKQFRNKLN